jgi:hypothetical protein
VNRAPGIFAFVHLRLCNSGGANMLFGLSKSASPRILDDIRVVLVPATALEMYVVWDSVEISHTSKLL